MISLSAEFTNTINSVYGDAGKRWIAGLDDLVAYCKDKWQFELLPEKKLSYSYLAPVIFRGGGKAVLKLSVPGAGVSAEAAVLKACNKRGYCGLIHAEPEKGLLILEQIEPGTSLKSVSDDTLAAGIAAELIKEMQQYNPGSKYPFQTAETWYKDLLALQKRSADHLVPENMFNNAVAAYQSLKSNPQAAKLLHGDLHQENILLGAHGKYTAIDPKGIIAETACELIPFLMNIPLKNNMVPVVDRCISIFSSKLDIDKQRIVYWGRFRAALSMYWKIEDNLPLSDEDRIKCSLFNSMGE